MRFRYASFVALLVSVLVSAEILAATVQPPHGFDSGDRGGWSAGRAGALPTIEPSGGPTGDGDSFLLVEATGLSGPASNVATFNNDAAWVGDFSTPGITGLSVDMMNLATSSPLSMRLVLFGPSNTSNRWTSTEFTTVPNDGAWRNYVFPISEAAFTRVGGSSTYDQVANAAVRVMLRHDDGTPSRGAPHVTATLGIDNIALLAASSLDCDQNDSVGVSDLDCANAAGITTNLLADLKLLPGDLDGLDGVAFADFLTLSANFGTDKEKYTDGNIDGVGGVEFADFLILSGNFGKTVEAGNTASVPEPCGWVLLLACGLTIASKRRRRVDK